MSSAPLPHPEDLDVTVALRFRCVCGAELPYREGGIDCPECGRHVSGQALAAQSQTLVFRRDGSTGPAPESPDDEAQRPQVGDRFGHFEIVELLGAGGMGAVYLALDTSLQRYVALKVIHTHGSGSSAAQRVNKLKQEAIAQARLNDPHVVTIYFVGDHEGQPFFAMELVPGHTIAERLTHGPIPFASLVEIAYQTCLALEHAQAFDIVHGDIKPSNLLLDEKGNVKLGDFGLARFQSKASGHDATISGTLDYLAPEIFRGQLPSFQSDMYSLGVALYEMTYGRLPYRDTGSSLNERIEAAQHRTWEFPDKPHEVPRAWIQVLQKLLADTPQDRFGSYAELRRSLKPLRFSHKVPAGRFPRIAAYVVDAVVASVMYGVTRLPLALLYLSELSGAWLVFKLMAYLIAPLGLLAFAFLESTWQKTPGRYLFQLQVVDQHQLPPPRTVLFLRSLLRFTWLWTIYLGAFGQFASSWLTMPVVVAGQLFLLADAATVIFGPAGWSLHDLVCRTRVMLDHSADENEA